MRKKQNGKSGEISLTSILIDREHGTFFAVDLGEKKITKTKQDYDC